jgi:hypothetical protein
VPDRAPRSVAPTADRPAVGAHGEGNNRETAIADLREALIRLIAEVGVPDELTLTLDVEAWSAELDRFAEVPLFRGRQEPAADACRGSHSRVNYLLDTNDVIALLRPELPGLDGLAVRCQG